MRMAIRIRRCVERKIGSVWSAQFCTEVAHPERFERPTLRFVCGSQASLGSEAFRIFDLGGPLTDSLG